MRWEVGMCGTFEYDKNLSLVCNIDTGLGTLELLNLYTKKRFWRKESKVIPFGIQNGDKLKLSRDGKYSVVCKVDFFSHDDRGNLKLHSEDLTLLTNYSSAYWEDIEKWLIEIVNT